MVSMSKKSSKYGKSPIKMEDSPRTKKVKLKFHSKLVNSVDFRKKVLKLLGTNLVGSEPSDQYK
jgi:hypothetical protein